MAPERATAAARPWPLLLAGVAVVLLVTLAVLHETAATPPPATAAARAYAIGERLACPICQGETVADSPSVLAQQMRGVIADQVAQGRSDAEIEQYFVDRYGTGILLAPPAQGFSLLAWALPLALLFGGGGGVALAAVRWSRRGAADALPALTAEEQARYGALLAQRLAVAAEDRGDQGGAVAPIEQGATASRDAGEDHGGEAATLDDGTALPPHRVGAAPRGRPAHPAHAVDVGNDLAPRHSIASVDRAGRPRGAAPTPRMGMIAPSERDAAELSKADRRRPTDAAQSDAATPTRQSESSPC